MPNGGLSAPQKRKWRLETELGPGFNKMLLVNGKVRWHCASLFRYNIAISRRCPQPVVCLLRAEENRRREDACYIALKRADARAMVRVLQSASIELVEKDATKIKLAPDEVIYAGGEGDFMAMMVVAPPTRLKRVLAESGIACSLWEPKAWVIWNMRLPWPTNG